MYIALEVRNVTIYQCFGTNNSVVCNDPPPPFGGINLAIIVRQISMAGMGYGFCYLSSLYLRVLGLQNHAFIHFILFLWVIITMDYIPTLFL